MISTRKQQKGASIFSIIVLLIIAGIFFTVGFKLYPAYFDNKLVDSVLTEMIGNNDELNQSKFLIKRTIKRKFTVNQIRLPQDSLKIIKEGNKVTLDLDYQVRVPMFANVDAMVKFKKKYEAEVQP
jgi:Tfp pilus assembly major pilin PilA